MKDNDHIPVPVQDEDESETSFDDEQNSLLDRLGVKIDDSLHRIFTSYVICFYCILNIIQLIYFSF